MEEVEEKPEEGLGSERDPRERAVRRRFSVKAYALSRHRLQIMTFKAEEPSGWAYCSTGGRSMKLSRYNIQVASGSRHAVEHHVAHERNTTH